MTSRLFLALCATCLLPLGACQVFDASLYQEAGMETDGHEEGGHHGEGEEVMLAPECFSDQTVPVLESEDAHRIGSTEDAGDEFSTYQGRCGSSTDYHGPDAFFALEMAAGERWHVAVSPEGEADVSIVTLATCDPQACSNVMDRCGPGRGEEITLVPDQAQTLIVGVDSVADGPGTEVEIVAVHTQCGNDVLEHAEACDDGNLADGDGCDANCRVELADALSIEAEPNNWHTEGNVLTGAQARVAGTIGGPCDTDLYVIHVPEGSTLTTSILDGAEQPCADGTPSISMRLVRAVTNTERGVGTVGRDAGSCPSIEVGDAFNEALPAGEYHLTIEAEREATVFDYILVLETSAAE